MFNEGGVLGWGNEYLEWIVEEDGGGEWGSGAEKKAAPSRCQVFMICTRKTTKHTCSLQRIDDHKGEN